MNNGEEGWQVGVGEDGGGGVGVETGQPVAASRDLISLRNLNHRLKCQHQSRGLL